MAQAVFDCQAYLLCYFEVYGFHFGDYVGCVFFHECGALGGVELFEVCGELAGGFVLLPVARYDFAYFGCGFVRCAFFAAANAAFAVVFGSCHNILIFDTKVVLSSIGGDEVACHNS